MWRTFSQLTAFYFSNKTRTLVDRFKRRPLLYPIVSFAAYVLYDFGSWHASLWWQRRKIVYTIRRGKSISVYEPAYICDREEIIDTIDNVLHPSDTDDQQSMIKVVVGPIGCGKTWCMTTAMNKNPKGIMYVDAQSIFDFPKKLGMAAGMNFSKKPTLIEVLRYNTSTFHRESVFVSLPNTSIARQINYVMGVLQESCLYYRKVFGMLPTLIIDNTDVIAKMNEEAFEVLIRLCKGLVNTRILNIVLVSSESHVISKLQDLSEGSRCGPMIHIPDVDMKDSMKFLQAYDFSPVVAKKIAESSGGRLLYLAQAKGVKDMAKTVGVDDDKLMELVLCHMTSKVDSDCKRSKLEVGDDLFAGKKAILDKLALGKISRRELLRYLYTTHEWKDPRLVAQALDELVNGNYVVLRQGEIVEFQTPLHQKFWEQIKLDFELK